MCEFLYPHHIDLNCHQNLFLFSVQVQTPFRSLLRHQDPHVRGTIVIQNSEKEKFGKRKTCLVFLSYLVERSLRLSFRDSLVT